MEYNSVNKYLKNKYGHKLYKVAIDGGFTCPNRDGKIDKRGCIFCSAKGSGDFCEDRFVSITDQIENGKKRVEGKNKDGKFIAYFQAFTNTYAPIDQLREKYYEAVNHPDVSIISIATRPDCLSDEVVELLKEINKIKPVWVELGLQTINELVAMYIRRGYTLDVYDEAIKKLKDAGIEIIVHVILGLPYENMEDMLNTVKYVAGYRDGELKKEFMANGIKLQLLHVLEGTDLAKDYLDGKFQTLELDEYVRIVVECLKVIPEEMVVHRITGDGDKKILIAPKWSGDKWTVLNKLNKAIKEAER